MYTLITDSWVITPSDWLSTTFPSTPTFYFFCVTAMKSFILLVALFGLTVAMRDQSIAVKGRLLCGNGPAANVRVKLWEEDTGKGNRGETQLACKLGFLLLWTFTMLRSSRFLRRLTDWHPYLILPYQSDCHVSSGPDPDDLLDQGYTDQDGYFSLQGGTAELTPIDPVFKVYHKCDDSKLKVCSASRDLTSLFHCSQEHEKWNSHFRKATSLTEKWPRRRLTLVSEASRGFWLSAFDVNLLGILNLETVFAKEERELLVSRIRRGGFNADYMDPDNKDESKSSEEQQDKPDASV